MQLNETDDGTIYAPIKTNYQTIGCPAIPL